VLFFYASFKKKETIMQIEENTLVSLAQLLKHLSEKITAALESDNPNGVLLELSEMLG
jgi:hypothetical protein